jgi:hypothetical protein
VLLVGVLSVAVVGFDGASRLLPGRDWLARTGGALVWFAAAAALVAAVGSFRARYRPAARIVADDDGGEEAASGAGVVGRPAGDQPVLLVAVALFDAASGVLRNRYWEPGVGVPFRAALPALAAAAVVWIAARTRPGH